jgi:DNA replication protein DnaC
MSDVAEDFAPPRAVGPCPRCRRPDAVWAGSSEPCERCQHDLHSEAAGSKKMKQGEATIPAGYAWATLDADLPAGEQLIARARQALDAGVRRAVFVGAAGSGKTSLAVAMMRAWMAKHRQAAHFAHAHRLGSARLKHRFGQGEADEIAAAIDAPLCLIDDLKDERLTSTTAIYDVLQERHADGLPTFVTTGLGLDEPTARARIIEIYGDGTARRILEGARIFDFSKKGMRAAAPSTSPDYDPRKRASGDDS